MRKFLLSIFSMLLLATFAANAATEKKATIWTGEQEFASDWSNNIMFSSDNLPTLTAGDELHFTVTAIADPSGWPQIKLNRYDWQDFATALSYGLWDETAPCEAVITLTKEAIDEITESGGFVLFGAGYTCTEISLYGQVAGSLTTDVWTGTQECTDSWSGNVTIASSKLPTLTAGDEIEIEVSAISSTCDWPQVKIAQYTWADFTTNISIGLWDATAPCTVSTALTQNNIDEIASSGGIVVFGAGYTMTKISVVKRSEAVSVAESGYSTYCPLNNGMDFSSVEESIAAYKATVSGDQVTLTRVEQVAKGEGVLLRNMTDEQGCTVNVPYSNDAEAQADNAFVGVETETTLYPEADDKYNFVLTSISGQPGFHLATKGGTHIAAGKAYLPIDKSNFSDTDSAKQLYISFSDDATAVLPIVFEPTKSTGRTYNIAGQRVDKSYRGLVITDGHVSIQK